MDQVSLIIQRCKTRRTPICQFSGLNGYRSGMRWRHDGGQAIFTLRALIQSSRFDSAWQLIAAEFKKDIQPLANVIAMASTYSR